MLAKEVNKHQKLSQIVKLVASAYFKMPVDSEPVG